jgi:hypothetical protein
MSWYAGRGRSGRYTSILAFSDSGNESPLAFRERLHAFQ